MLYRYNLRSKIVRISRALMYYDVSSVYPIKSIENPVRPEPFVFAQESFIEGWAGFFKYPETALFRFIDVMNLYRSMA